MHIFMKVGEEVLIYELNHIYILWFSFYSLENVLALNARSIAF